MFSDITCKECRCFIIVNGSPFKNPVLDVAFFVFVNVFTIPYTAHDEEYDQKTFKVKVPVCESAVFAIVLHCVQDFVDLRVCRFDSLHQFQYALLILLVVLYLNERNIKVV